MADAPAFQFNPQSGIVGANNNPIPVPQLDVQGGRDTPVHAPQMFSSGDSVDAQFPSFLASAFAPKLQAAQQEQFWQGFTAARTGSSLQEIHDEQPWYSKIFGPTNFEMGAQTFAVQKATADVEQQFQEQLPQLRTMDSGTVAKHLSDISQSAMTGDIYADSLIQKNMMERAGPMMEIHAKAHYAWQQETLAKDQHGVMMSASAAYQSAMQNNAQLGTDHPDQAMTPEQSQEQTRNLLHAFQPPMNQDPNSYMKNVLSTVDQMAQQGHWYTIRALRDAGAFSALNPDQQDQLDKRIDRARSHWQSNLTAGPLAQDITMLQAQAHSGQISAKQVFDGFENINKSYQAMTGDDQPLFDQKDISSSATSAADAVFHAWDHMQNRLDSQYEKAQTQQEKQDAKNADMAYMTVAAKTQKLGTAVNIGKTKEEAEQALDSAISADPMNFNQYVVGNLSAADQPFHSERLAKRLQSQVANSAGEEYTQGFETAYQTWKGMQTYTQQTPGGIDRTSGPNAAAMYFGPYATKLDTYDKQLQAGVPKEVAYRMTFGNAASEGQGDLRTANPLATSADNAAVRKQWNSAIQDFGPSWWNPFSGASMGSTGHELLAQASAPYFAQRLQMGWSPSDAAQAAIQAAQANGFERGGSYAWQNIKGQKPVAAIAGMAMANGEGTDTFSKAFDSMVSNRLRAQGMSVGKNSSVTVARLSDDPDPKVGARMVVVGYDPDTGKMKQVNLTTKDLLLLRDQQAAQERADNAAKPGLTHQSNSFGSARGI